MSQNLGVFGSLGSTYLEDQKTSGTNSAASTSDAWDQRDINTIVHPVIYKRARTFMELNS